MLEEEEIEAAQNGDETAFAALVDRYRRGLRAHCYRMSGSLHDADDLLQESLLRAWRGLPGFERRANLRSWLYRVTTNACLDVLERKSARVLPQDLRPAMAAGEEFLPPNREPIWLSPCPADLYSDRSEVLSPEVRYTQRESVALAFLTALQQLPARQRAALILRDVLGWQASDCADLLDLTVAAVNSALQRARETIAKRAGAAQESAMPIDSRETRELLARYVQAWEQADMDSLVALLREDATLAMPPMSQWISGAQAIGQTLSQMVFQPNGPGAFRFTLTELNGQPAVASYLKDPKGKFRGYAVHLLELRENKLAGIMAFLDPSLFAPLGLPEII